MRPPEDPGERHSKLLVPLQNTTTPAKVRPAALFGEMAIRGSRINGPAATARVLPRGPAIGGM
jgi:hypothetical protein